MASAEHGTGASLARRVAGNTGIQVGAQAVGMALSLVFVRLTTGHLGPQAFGEFAIILGVSGIVTILADVGMTTTLARELAKTPDRADELGGNLLRARMVSATGYAVITLAALPVLPYSRETKIGLAISLVGVVFTTLASFPKAFFQVHLQLHRQATLDLTQKLLNIVAVSASIALGLGLLPLVAMLSAVNVLVCASAFLLSRPFWRPNMRFSWVVARPLLRDTIGIGVLMMVGLLHFRVDSVLLSLLRPPADVGVYTIAYRFVEQAFLLPGVLLAAMFPILTRYLHDRDQRLGGAVNRTFQVLLVAGLGLALLVFTLARPLVHLFAGAGYDGAIRPARVLALVLPILFVTPVFSSILISLNRQGALLKIGVVALSGNVVANLVLIPPYGPEGAAWVTLGSEAFVLVCGYALVRRSVDVHVELAILPRALAAAAAGILGAWLAWRTSEILAAGLAAAVFVVVALAVGAVRRSDLELILSRGR